MTSLFCTKLLLLAIASSVSIVRQVQISHSFFLTLQGL